MNSLPTITMSLVLAVRSDFIDASNKWNLGKMYFLRSAVSDEFTNHPYYISYDMDKKDFSEMFKANLVYVPRHMFNNSQIESEASKIHNLKGKPPDVICSKYL